MTGWQWFWAGWVALGAVAEGIALATNYRNTLSEQVWALEGHKGSLVQLGVGVFTGWLFVHMTFHLYYRLR